MKTLFFLAIGFIYSQSLMAQSPFDVDRNVNVSISVEDKGTENVVVIESRQWKATGYQNAQKSGELFEIGTAMYIIEIAGTGMNNFTISRTDNVQFSKTFNSASEAKNFKLEPGKYSVLPNRPKDKSAVDAWDVNLGLVLYPYIR